MPDSSSFLIGQRLVERDIITQEQLDKALQRQRETGDLLGVTLLKMGFVDEEAAFLPFLADQLGIEFVMLRNKDIPAEVITQVPARFVTFYKIVPVNFEGDVLTIASAHPMNIDVIDGLGMASSSRIRTVLASEKDILETIRKYYGVGAETIDQMMGDVEVDHEESTTAEIDELDSEASIGKFVNQILLEAFKDRATDIHIEPFEKDLKIRYRVDGILQDAQVPVNIWRFKDSINSRIKIMSNLNIAEKRLPQDGRFKVRVNDVDLDLRVSFLPTQFGESVVIRLLSSSSLISLSDLGLTDKNFNILKDLIHRPHGIIFVTGPTGSGKTTTLYGSLHEVNDANRKIITIEDPVEYQLKGVTQVQINPGIGLTFSAGLRSMLRHDPDIMMVGEVRDLETAEIAVQIALTGHLVFSTLHTNDAASGVTRLVDMGVEPYLVSSSVECFIAQRLIRMICPKCKESYQPTPEVLTDLGVSGPQAGPFDLYRGKGCEACNMTGYHGRQGIYEFLVMDEEIKEMVSAKASAAQIKKKAVELGMKTLLQDGWEKVRQGKTTPDEVIRVTKEEAEG